MGEGGMAMIRYEWFTYDSDEGFETYASEAEAVHAGQSLIEGWLADGWAEEVEDVRVGQITYWPVKETLGVRAEMTAEAWDELTHADPDSDEWWKYNLEPISGDPT